MNRITFMLENLALTREDGYCVLVPKLPDFHVDYDPGAVSVSSLAPIDHVIGLPGGIKLRMRFDIAGKLSSLNTEANESESTHERVELQVEGDTAEWRWNAGVNLGIVHFGVSGKG
jgi:hypothetical protein